MTVSRVISLNLCRPLDGIDSNVCDQVILIHGHDQNQLLKKGNLVELLPGTYHNGLVMTQKGLVITLFSSNLTAFTLASSRYSLIPQVGGHYCMTDLFVNWYFNMLSSESTPSNCICLLIFVYFILYAVLSDSLNSIHCVTSFLSAATM